MAPSITKKPDTGRMNRETQAQEAMRTLDARSKRTDGLDGPEGLSCTALLTAQYVIAAFVDVKITTRKQGERTRAAVRVARRQIAIEIKGVDPAEVHKGVGVGFQELRMAYASIGAANKAAAIERRRREQKAARAARRRR